MIKLNQNKQVKFDALTHSYWIGDKELSGITTLMKVLGLSPDYSGIPKATLAKAAERGSALHDLIDRYNKGEDVILTPELKAYKQLGLNVVASEYLVSDNETVASSIDVVGYVDDSTVDLFDIKYTSTLHRDALASQLGFYAYLFELQNPHLKVRNCYALHFRNEKAKQVQIAVITRGQAQEYIARKREGRLNDMPLAAPELPSAGEVLPAKDIAQMVKAEMAIAEAKALIKDWEKKTSEIKDRIICYMKDNHLTELATEGGVFKLKDEYARETIDSKKLKEKYPDIASELTKVSVVKASVSYKANKQ